jgi:hypothetical protein
MLFIHSIINIKNIISHPTKNIYSIVHIFCSCNNMKNYTISKKKSNERNKRKNRSKKFRSHRKLEDEIKMTVTT